MAAALDAKLAAAAPIGFGIGGFALVVAMLISFARGSDIGLSQRHMAVGFAGAFLSLVADICLSRR